MVKRAEYIVKYAKQHKFSIADDKRDADFKKLGYKVLRFWDSEVDKDIEKVLERIKSVARV